MLTVECTVNGTPFGITIWKGDIFDCPANEISLLHSRFTHEQRECNGRSIIGQGVKVENNQYTSWSHCQLNIILDENMVGKVIECYFEAAESGNPVLIDLLTINTTGNVSWGRSGTDSNNNSVHIVYYYSVA